MNSTLTTEPEVKIKRQWKSASELLSPKQLADLSTNAACLYAYCWNIMNGKQQRQVFITNIQAISRLGMFPHDLAFAQQELQHAGLLDIRLEPVPSVYVYRDTAPEEEAE